MVATYFSLHKQEAEWIPNGLGPICTITQELGNSSKCMTTRYHEGEWNPPQDLSHPSIRPLVEEPVRYLMSL